MEEIKPLFCHPRRGSALIIEMKQILLRRMTNPQDDGRYKKYKNSYTKIMQSNHLTFQHSKS